MIHRHIIDYSIGGSSNSWIARYFHISRNTVACVLAEYSSLLEEGNTKKIQHFLRQPLGRIKSDRPTCPHIAVSSHGTQTTESWESFQYRTTVLKTTCRPKSQRTFESSGKAILEQTYKKQIEQINNDIIQQIARMTLDQYLSVNDADIREFIVKADRLHWTADKVVLEFMKLIHQHYLLRSLVTSTMTTREKTCCTLY